MKGARQAQSGLETTSSGTVIRQGSSMERFMLGPYRRSSSDDVDEIDGRDVRQPFLEVDGVHGSSLRATPEALIVCSTGGAWSNRQESRRTWTYDQIGSIRLDAYGSVGVIRATVGSTGGTLPLLLLEPQQINAARRIVEIIANLMVSAQHERRTA